MSKKIEIELVNLLTEGMYHNWNVYEITTVESCTAGMIASKIASVPGASKTLRQAYVTYCDEAKKTLVGVKEETIKKFGVVSEEVVKEMAEGGLVAADANVSIAVTGFAGKSNIPRVKDNTICIGIAVNDINGKSETRTYTFIFKGKRNRVRIQAANRALKLAYLVVNELLGHGQAEIRSRRLKDNNNQDKPKKRKHSVTVTGCNNSVICGGDINVNKSTKTKYSSSTCVVNGEKVRIPHTCNSVSIVGGDVYINGKLYYRQGLGYIDELDETEKKLNNSLNRLKQHQIDWEQFEKSMEQMSENLENMFKKIK